MIDKTEKGFTRKGISPCVVFQAAAWIVGNYVNEL